MLEMDWIEREREKGVVIGFRQDSREVRAGDVFFAMKGERVDGHRFLGEVREKGAIAAVVSEEYRGDSYGLHLLRVADVKQTLQEWAKTVRSRKNMRVIGVTGSVGKTTTKEFIYTLLKGKFKTAKTPGNANSQVSVPLALLNTQEECDCFVIEMGMTASGEISRLVDIARPEIAVLTKVALSHALFFPEGLEQIAAAKAEIFSHEDTKWGVMNQQVLQFSTPFQTGSCEKLSYSLSSENPFSDFILFQENDLFFIREGIERSPLFSLPFRASHLLEDFLAAAVVARKMGMEWEEIIPQTPHLRPYKNRFETVEKEGIVFLNDSYNANPTSMLAALRHLPSPKPGGKRIAVLAAMKELGAFSLQCHLEVAREALLCIDDLLCLGEECEPMVDYFRQHERPAVLYSHLEEVREHLNRLAKTGDVVLVKGSNSYQLWKLL